MRPAIALALFTLLGCRGDAPDVTQPVPVAGTYALAKVRGSPLPAEYAPGVLITSGRMTVLAAGTWTEARSNDAPGGVQSTVFYGTWTESGSDLAFRVGATLFYTGVATSGGLRLASGSAIFEYSRE